MPMTSQAKEKTTELWSIVFEFEMKDLHDTVGCYFDDIQEGMSLNCTNLSGENYTCVVVIRGLWLLSLPLHTITLWDSPANLCKNYGGAGDEDVGLMRCFCYVQ